MTTDTNQIDVDALIEYYQIDVKGPEHLKWLRENTYYFVQNKEYLETEKRRTIIRNRLNAMKSTGPKTVLGKQKSSQNALKHGLTSKRVMLKGERTAQFKKFETEMLADLAPADQVERVLADRVITLTWRLRRAESMESAVIDAMGSKKQDVGKNGKPRVPYNQLPPKLSEMICMAIQEDCPDKFLAAVSFLPDFVCDRSAQPSPEQTLGALALDDFNNSGVLEKILRYQRQIENSLYKAIAELERRQYIRLRTAALTCKLASAPAEISKPEAKPEE